MFKNIISPVQAWLLSQGRCVGCGSDLSEGIKVEKHDQNVEVTCRKCGRIFLYNMISGKYKRALLSRK